MELLRELRSGRSHGPRAGEVQRETEAREGVLPEGYSGSEIHMRRNISVALSQQASGLLSEFLQMQGAHQEWHRGEVTRCVRFFFGASAAPA